MEEGEEEALSVLKTGSVPEKVVSHWEGVGGVVICVEE